MVSEKFYELLGKLGSCAADAATAAAWNWGRGSPATVPYLKLQLSASHC